MSEGGRKCGINPQGLRMHKPCRFALFECPRAVLMRLALSSIWQGRHMNHVT